MYLYVVHTHKTERRQLSALFVVRGVTMDQSRYEVKLFKNYFLKFMKMNNSLEGTSYYTTTCQPLGSFHYHAFATA